MQQEFYIGQKVRTSKVGIKTGCSSMQGVIIASCTGYYAGAFHVKYINAFNKETLGIFMPEEIEPLEDSSVSEIVFDNIAKSL